MKRKLTNTQVKNAKPKNDGKPSKHSDGGGLFLLVRQNKDSLAKLWRYSYRFNNKQKTVSIGGYPDISLKDAREEHERMRELLAKDIDPSTHKQIEKQHRLEASDNSFKKVALEWFSYTKPTWKSKEHADRTIRLLEKDIFPYMGNRPIAELEPPEVLVILRKMESRGVGYSAHKAKQVCGQVFRYGVGLGLCKRDPTADLKGLLRPTEVNGFAAIVEPVKVGELLRITDEYSGDFVTQCALKFIALTFVRSGNLRHAEWSEFDFDKRTWTISADKMKAKRKYITPLSQQAIQVLEDIKPLTGHGKYVFPSMRSSDRGMSENTINAALRRMGISKDEHTCHGYRKTASSLLNESGLFNPDAIEVQSARKDSTVRGIYNKSLYWDERVRMVQWYADYLDQLRKGGEVIQGDFRKAE